MANYCVAPRISFHVAQSHDLMDASINALTTFNLYLDMIVIVTDGYFRLVNSFFILYKDWIIELSRTVLVTKLLMRRCRCSRKIIKSFNT